MNGFLLGAWIACQAFDTSTTAIALARPSYVEANPLMKHGYVVRISGNVFNALVWRKENARQRAITATATMLSGCLAGGWNTYQLKRAR